MLPLHTRLSNMHKQEKKHTQAQDIMKLIHNALWNDWDPLGLKGWGPEDEYDSYIGGVYRILSGNPIESELVEHLYQIETEMMGLPPRKKELLFPIAQKLIKIDVTLKEE